MTKPTATPAEPPYLRIVAAIRRRIADGELMAGDRVPSTRQIAREWGVALATATKALTTLRLEGLVETRPRTGTVVAGAASPAASPARPSTSSASSAGAPASEQELTLERIVRTGMAIADAEGLSALSMRGVAARLGVAAMSLYRYVTGKDDLVLLMADTAYGEESYPADPPEGWRPRVELGARTLWTLYRRHPWLAQLGPISRPLPLPNLMVHGEWVLSALEGHGLDPTRLFDVHVLIYSHSHGLAVHLEREAQAEAATGQSDDEWMDSRAPTLQWLAESGRFPAFTRIVGAFGDGYDLRLDALFEFGLTALLDGLTPIIEGREATSRWTTNREATSQEGITP
ncbi:TetR/AcrR family transcriptional regulator C-terminal domain-containing protein [Streptomyces sp. NPDC086993]|uniref:TetR/AcrR family transcriptional regulator C-terminal domain-containing protein n=1 Tax=Streptomyces sp. NPDC086993 TaxID=3365765 RepID=UPI003828353C